MTRSGQEAEQTTNPSGRGLFPTAAAARLIRAGLRRIDPSWLFLISGAALASGALLAPALDDLGTAEHERDVARAVAGWHEQRLRRYSDFVTSIDARDPVVLRSLAMSQLNLAPESSELLGIRSSAGVDDASVFGHLEPVFRMPMAPPPRKTILARMTQDPRERRWVIACGVFITGMGLVGVGRPKPANTRGTEANPTEKHQHGRLAGIRDRLAERGWRWRLSDG